MTTYYACTHRKESIFYSHLAGYRYMCEARPRLFRWKFGFRFENNKFSKFYCEFWGVLFCCYIESKNPASVKRKWKAFIPTYLAFIPYTRTSLALINIRLSFRCISFCCTFTTVSRWFQYDLFYFLCRRSFNTEIEFKLTQIDA